MSELVDHSIRLGTVEVDVWVSILARNYIMVYFTVIIRRRLTLPFVRKRRSLAPSMSQQAEVKEIRQIIIHKIGAQGQWSR